MAHLDDMKRLLTILAAATLGVAGCHSDDHDHSTLPASCAEIVERCHPLDLGSGPVHECHENAEGVWDDATCTAKKASCFATCTASDGGSDTGSDTGGGDTGRGDTGGDTGKADAPAEAASETGDAASDATDAASDTPAG